MKTWLRIRVAKLRRWASTGALAAWSVLRATFSARDVVILLGLALVWLGLRDVYRPAAPIVVGAFLLWFTTIRRVPQ